MYILKIAGKDQVSFGPVPVMMVVKNIWSTVQSGLDHTPRGRRKDPHPPPPNFASSDKFHPANKPYMTGPSLLSCSRKRTTLPPSYLITFECLDLPERLNLPERPPKYRKDQRIIGN